MFKKAFVALCMVLFSVAAFADAPENQIDFSMISQKSHPRLLMNENSFANLKARMETSPTLAKLHEIIFATLENEMRSKEALQYKLDASGKRLLSQSRRAILRMAGGAYAYRMTGEQKYLSFVEDQLNTVCAFPNWNEKHYLDVGEMALAVSIAYDWLYDELGPEVRAKAEKAISDNAFRTAIDEKYRHRFYQMMNNWNQVCNGGLVAGALAFYDKYPQDAQILIQKAVDSNKKPMEVMYSPDGNYVEGYIYWRYGTAYEVLMLKMFEQNFGTDFGLSQIPGFMKTADFMLFMEGIRGGYSHSDSSTGSSPAQAMWYFAEKLKRPELIFNEVAAIRKGKYRRFDDERLLPLFMSFLENVDLENVAKPKADVWYGYGENPIFMVRRDWSSSKSDAYLAVKGGKANNSHAHMDAGSFVYDAYGQRWAHDLGMQPYARVEKIFKETGGNLWDMKQDSRRWDLLRYNNYHHNTITLNDALHEVGGMATFKEIIENKKEKGVVVDMSKVFEPHARSVERTVKMLKNNDLMVVDKVTAKDGASVKYSWRMVTDAAPDVKNNHIYLEKGGETMKLKATSEVEFKYCTWSAEPKEEFDSPNKNMVVVGIEAVVPAGTEASFTVTLTHM